MLLPLRLVRICFHCCIPLYLCFPCCRALCPQFFPSQPCPHSPPPRSISSPCHLYLELSADCSNRCYCVRPWCRRLWMEVERSCLRPPPRRRSWREWGGPAADLGVCSVPECADGDASFCVYLPVSGPVKHNSGHDLKTFWEMQKLLVKSLFLGVM